MKVKINDSYTSPFHRSWEPWYHAKDKRDQIYEVFDEPIIWNNKIVYQVCDGYHYIELTHCTPIYKLREEKIKRILDEN